jgi:hypothetical protein
MLCNPLFTIVSEEYIFFILIDQQEMYRARMYDSAQKIIEKNPKKNFLQKRLVTFDLGQKTRL